MHEAALANERVIRNEIGEEVLGINFRYLNRTDKNWVDRWDSETTKELPSGGGDRIDPSGPR
ncbi:MAG: hypothetical protein MPW15_01385 [Candidatus Manganitrophus sp.]|nr:hypothetical protein [Candidatus Manganitrophus sp.]